jgi:seryl-tRNA synthetase
MSALSKQIGALMKAKKPNEAAEMKAQVAAIKETLKTQEEKSISLEAERDLKLCQVKAPLPPPLLPAHTTHSRAHSRGHPCTPPHIYVPASLGTARTERIAAS